MFIFDIRIVPGAFRMHMVSGLYKSFANGRSQLVDCTKHIDQLSWTAATDARGCCYAIANEGVETGHEIGTDSIEVLHLSRQNLLEGGACKEIPGNAGVFERDFGHGKIEPVRPDSMIDIGGGWRWIGVVIRFR